MNTLGINFNFQTYSSVYIYVCLFLLPVCLNLLAALFGDDDVFAVRIRAGPGPGAGVLVLVSWYWLSFRPLAFTFGFGFIAPAALMTTLMAWQEETTGPAGRLWLFVYRWHIHLLGALIISNEPKTVSYVGCPSDYVLSGSVQVSYWLNGNLSARQDSLVFIGAISFWDAATAVAGRQCQKLHLLY